MSYNSIYFCALGLFPRIRVSCIVLLIHFRLSDGEFQWREVVRPIHDFMGWRQELLPRHCLHCGMALFFPSFHEQWFMRYGYGCGYGGCGCGYGYGGYGHGCGYGYGYGYGCGCGYGHGGYGLRLRYSAFPSCPLLALCVLQTCHVSEPLAIAQGFVVSLRADVAHLVSSGTP